MASSLPLEDKHARKAELRVAQTELVKLQRHIIETGQKVLVIFEGRDAAGKDGAIKRIIQHLSPRDLRVVALGPPSNRERHAWYYQRYVAHLPVDGELVLMNRSWYNRAGVEHVMEYCAKAEYKSFFEATPLFENLLLQCGMTVIKYYLDISKGEQKRRLKDRRDDELSQWKTSPVDAVALKHWDDYSEARNVMLLRTHSAVAPWTIVRADDKPLARIAIIKDLLTRLEYPDKPRRADTPNPGVVFPFDEAMITNGMLAK